jgi:acyl-CoA reductase-like NAD-dependent aldehyde dehydrogenase
MPGRERAKYLYRIARIVQERSRELAVLESVDNGKPIRESRDVDLPLVAAHFFYYAGWADKLGHAGFGPDPRPVGVAAQVIPWNFPLLMLAWKIAPALACGNTVVLKPAETTSLTALLFAEICRWSTSSPERGRPAGCWWSTRASTRSRSPARPTSGGGSRAAWPAPASGSRWSWAARPPT